MVSSYMMRRLGRCMNGRGCRDSWVVDEIESYHILCY